MKFMKMQGCGNDYVYINCFEEDVKEPSKLAIKVSNRNFGIGSDGLILIMPPSEKNADCKMRMFNSDGTESEMCGNGIRCVGKYVHDKAICTKDTLKVETLCGIKILTFEKNIKGEVEKVTVNMGKVIFEPNLIPINILDSDKYGSENPVKNLKLKAYDKEFTFTCLSMGNPHAVTFIDNVDSFDVLKYGKMLESNNAFPKRANIEFVEVIDTKNVKMRVYERGSGETLACGTGTCATVVASYLNGKTLKEDVTVKLLGGELLINFKDGYVYMTGPAKFVFEGVLYE